MVKITNPYQFFTKGEMIINCKNTDFLTKNIKNTMSLFSSGFTADFLKKKQPSHCGFCLPCVIRRAAIKKSGIKDTSIYRRPDFNGSNEAEMCLNSYKLGLAKFNVARAFLDIQKSGPIVDNIENYTNLYIRGNERIEGIY